MFDHFAMFPDSSTSLLLAVVPRLSFIISPMKIIVLEEHSISSRYSLQDNNAKAEDRALPKI